jgi:hypothetical protein
LILSFVGYSSKFEASPKEKPDPCRRPWKTARPSEREHCRASTISIGLRHGTRATEDLQPIPFVEVLERGMRVRNASEKLK